MDKAIEIALTFWSAFFTGLFYGFIIILPILVGLVLVYIGTLLMDWHKDKRHG